LIDVPSNQQIQKDYPDTWRIQKDVLDDQKTSETEEGYEDLSGSRPSTIECDEMSVHGHLFTVLLDSHT